MLRWLEMRYGGDPGSRARAADRGITVQTSCNHPSEASVSSSNEKSIKYATFTLLSSSFPVGIKKRKNLPARTPTLCFLSHTRIHPSKPSPQYPYSSLIDIPQAPATDLPAYMCSNVSQSCYPSAHRIPTAERPASSCLPTTPL